MSGPAVRSADLVLVGAGPQALKALVELDDALLAQRAARPVRVIACDPCRPGAGAVWDPAQPPHLRMNIEAGHVDMRCASVPLDLRDWHLRRLGAPCRRYPSRAVVGRYLAWAWERLSASPRLDVSHLRGAVVSATPTAFGWRCETGEGSAVEAPRIVLCTGHEGGTGIDHAALVAGTAPATAAGAGTVIRGAALTGFDAVLSLTEGRGGEWIEERTGAGPRLRYRPCGREPERILLVSRTGRLMLPKPLGPLGEDALAAVDGLRECWTETAPLSERWWDTLHAAARLAASAHGIDLDEAALRGRLADPPATVGDAAVATRWRADLRRAAGRTDADASWWLGRAWSAAHADILSSIERLPREPRTWERFQTRRATLERWAFGPPAGVVEKMLALQRHGVLGFAVESQAPPRRGSDVVAHLPGPGVLRRPRAWEDGPAGGIEIVAAAWRGLIERGHATVRPGEVGVMTTPTGECVGADGSPTPGLSALGRPTEGPVVDHDSLLRTLHPEARRWAARTAEELVRRARREDEEERSA